MVWVGKKPAWYDDPFHLGVTVIIMHLKKLLNFMVHNFMVRINRHFDFWTTPNPKPTTEPSNLNETPWMDASSKETNDFRIWISDQFLF